MKRIVLLIAALAAITGLSAQITHTAQGAVDQTAESLIAKASAKMSGTVAFSVTVINYDSSKKETFRKKASILYNAPRYQVKAGDIEVYCDGKTVWQLNRTAKEVMVTNMTESDDDLTNPAKLLANYKKNYRAKYIREDADGTAVVDLQPKKSAPYHKIRLYIVAKTGLLKKLEQHNYDSSRGEYTVSNFKNTKAADADFVFDAKANPGIEVVDMR